MRLRLSGLLVAVLAGVVVGSLWMDWYAMSLDSEREVPLAVSLLTGSLDLRFSGWKAFGGRDVVLAVAAGIAALGGAAAASGGPRWSAGLDLARLAALGALLVVLTAIFSSPLDRFALAGDVTVS